MKRLFMPLFAILLAGCVSYKDVFYGKAIPELQIESSTEEVRIIHRGLRTCEKEMEQWRSESFYETKWDQSVYGRAPSRIIPNENAIVFLYGKWLGDLKSAGGFRRHLLLSGNLLLVKSARADFGQRDWERAAYTCIYDPALNSGSVRVEQDR